MCRSDVTPQNGYSDPLYPLLGPPPSQAQHTQEPKVAALRILIIEDNPDIVANLVMFLTPLNYVVKSARDGWTGLAMACEGEFDAIVLDLGLPGLDGLEVCRRLRSDMLQVTAILLLTARDTLQDKVIGFENGADDYLVKPFSMIELHARLKALVRRTSGQQKLSIVRFADVSLDLSVWHATRAGFELRFTPTGYKLLAILLRKAPNLVLREELVREVWGDTPPDSDALRTHIHSLRVVLDKPFESPMLQTVPGLGYKLAQAHA
jgi:DNA-binding response OmpR family regulator